ncbi:MAG TPA: TolC family protein [Cytophagaceae bacterium]|nr:TolC family protein [Cytophagaceae bacterium]
MKKILLLIFVLPFVGLKAQQFSLKQSIDYALANQEQLKNLDIDRQLVEKKISEAYTTLFPQVKGVLDVRDNFILPTSLIPASAFGGPPGEYKAVQFGQKYNGTAALDATWTLYDPVFYPSLRAQKLSNDVAANNKKVQENLTVLNVNRAYYSALLSKERITLAESNMRKNKKVYEDTRTLYESNQTQDLDLTRSRINYENQLPELKRAQQLYEQSLFMLKYQMGYPVDSNLVLTDTLLLKQLAPSLSEVTAENEGPGSRPEYKTLKYQQAQEFLNVRKTKLAYLPTVSLYGYAGAQAFRPKFDMFSGNATWYGVSYLGLKVSLPIFDGMLKSIQTQESKLTLRKKENDLRAFEKQYAYELQNAKINVNNALSNIEIRKNNIKSAESLVAVTQTRYNDGLVTYKDVVDSGNTLLDAQTGYFNALYDYISAKLEYDKVLNKLQ